MTDPAKAATMQEKTIEALKDGSFRNNVVKSLKAFGGSPNKIRHLELWGQEQILTLDYFVDRLDEWLETFPNLCEIFFSTNGQAGPEKILRLITELEKHATHEIRFSLQWSYDGSYSGENLRHDTDNNVINNLTYVLTELNNIPLEKVKVQMYLHGVVSFELIKHLNGDMEKIKAYWEEGIKTAASMPALCWNKNVDVGGNFSIAEEVPYSCSTEEALDYYDFLLKSSAVGGSLQGLEFLSSQWSRILNNEFGEKSSENLDDVINWLNQIASSNNLEEMDLITRKLTNGFYCGTGVSELKIMWDGTLVTCQNSVFETTKDFINKDITIMNEVKRSWVDKGFFINPITATPEEIKKYKYLFMVGRKSTFWHTFTTNVVKLHYLSLCGQVSRSYARDLKQLLKHAYLMSFINQCGYNNAVTSGSLWTKDTGILRRYGNGFAKFCEELESNNRINNSGSRGH